MVPNRVNCKTRLPDYGKYWGWLWQLKMVKMVHYEVRGLKLYLYLIKKHLFYWLTTDAFIRYTAHTVLYMQIIDCFMLDRLKEDYEMDWIAQRSNDLRLLVCPPSKLAFTSRHWSYWGRTLFKCYGSSWSGSKTPNILQSTKTLQLLSLNIMAIFFFVHKKLWSVYLI